MKKKSLLTLLVAPLILTGCGTKEPEKPKAGDRGEDVLTTAEKQALYAKENDDYSFEVKYETGKVVSKDDYGTVPTFNQGSFRVFYHSSSTGTAEWLVVSTTSGAITSLVKGYGYSVEEPQSFSRLTVGFTNSEYGNTFIDLLYYSAYFKSEGYKNVYNNVVDEFGNTVWRGTGPRSKTWFTSANPYIGEDGKYYLNVVYRDENNSYQTDTLVYGDGFKTLTKVDNKDASKSVFARKVVVDGITYTVTDENQANVCISYTDNEGKQVINYYKKPNATGAFVGHYYVYQRIEQTNIHADDYEVISYGGGIKLHTYRYDITTNKEEEITNFPYYMRSINSRVLDPEEFEEGKTYAFPNYAVADFVKVEDKHFVMDNLCYVVDQDLVFHDDLLNYCGTNTGYFTKLGESHYYAGRDIYDSEFKYVGSFEGWYIQKAYPKCLLVENELGLYGILGEDGKFLVAPEYTSYAIIGGLIRLDKYFGTVAYYNPYSLKLIETGKDAKREYQPYDVGDYQQGEFCRLIGEYDEETAKYDSDEFYFLDTKLIAVDHFETASMNYKEFKQGYSTYERYTAEYFDADGDRTYLVFSSSYVAKEAQ